MINRTVNLFIYFFLFLKTVSTHSLIPVAKLFPLRFLGSSYLIVNRQGQLAEDILSLHPDAIAVEIQQSQQEGKRVEC